MTDLTVDVVAIESLRNDEANARRHSRRNLDAIKASLEEFGQRRPLVVTPDLVVMAGNGTLDAARELGWIEIAVTVLPWEDEQRARAFAIADNRAGEFAAWDEERLLEHLRSADAAGLAPSRLGFSETDLRRLGSQDATPDDAEIPDRPRKATSRKGDLWLLGDHRLVCGDTTDRSLFAALMQRERAALVHTDPPYGVDYVAPSGKHKPIAGDHERDDRLVRLIASALKLCAKYTADTAAFYIWHASATRDDFSYAMKAAGLAELQYLVWAKPAHTLGHAHYQWAHEPCFYASKAGVEPAWYGDRAQPTIWRIAQRPNPATTTVTVGPGLQVTDGNGHQLWIAPAPPARKRVRTLRLDDGQALELHADDDESTVWEVGRDAGVDHPTPKPVELARRALENSSRPGDLVLDPFIGGGCTLMAAERTGRRCYAAELDRGYCDVVVERWQQLTGGNATRQRA